MPSRVAGGFRRTDTDRLLFRHSRGSTAGVPHLFRPPLRSKLGAAFCLSLLRLKCSGHWRRNGQGSGRETRANFWGRFVAAHLRSSHASPKSSSPPTRPCGWIEECTPPRRSEKHEFSLRALESASRSDRRRWLRTSASRLMVPVLKQNRTSTCGLRFRRVRTEN